MDITAKRARALSTGHPTTTCGVEALKIGRPRRMTERKSRREIIRKLPDKSQAGVIHQLDVLERQLGRKGFSKMFKTITSDNGSAFLGSSEMERSCLNQKKGRPMVYYAHLYSAY